MASTGKDTGHGGTIAFSAGITAFAVPFRKIGAVEHAIEKIETTNLGNAATDPADTPTKSYIPGDVIDPGEFEVEYAFDAEDDLPDIEKAGTITITAPLATGQATAANLAGSGFIMACTAMPEAATNGLQIGKLKCRFDGKTGPALTVAVDS
jgi:hypothetical protein